MSKLMKLRKTLEKKNITTEMNDPTHWVSTGNAALNYRLTGNIERGLCNKRSLILWGESGSGKSFISANIARNAQRDGYVVIYLDSEHSMSEDYMLKIGMDLSPEMYIPINIVTIEETIVAVSEIFSTFDKDEKFIIVIDSLAGLLSEKEEGEFDKGQSKGDMGQVAKKLKLMVKNINNKIASYDAFCVMVTHAYLNQDLLNGEGKWIATGGKGLAFFPSFSIKLEKAKLKEAGETLNGVRMKCEVVKTRFTAPFQKCVLHVPYDTGIEYTDGLLEILEEEGIVQRTGGWYSYEKDGEVVKFQKSKLADHLENVMAISNARNGGVVEESEDYVPE